MKSANRFQSAQQTYAPRYGVPILAFFRLSRNEILIATKVRIGYFSQPIRQSLRKYVGARGESVRKVSE